MKMNEYTTIDDYLANFSGETKEKLETIRALCHKEVPESGEKISYGVPTLTLNGKYWIYFAGYDSHVAIYPPPYLDDPILQQEIQPYKKSKGTLRFENTQPLPIELIKKIIKAKHQDYLDRMK